MNRTKFTVERLNMLNGINREDAFDTSDEAVAFGRALDPVWNVMVYGPWDAEISKPRTLYFKRAGVAA